MIRKVNSVDASCLNVHCCDKVYTPFASQQRWCSDKHKLWLSFINVTKLFKKQTLGLIDLELAVSFVKCE